MSWFNLLKQNFIFFSTQLLLKMPVFAFNNRFVFHQAWAMDIQSNFYNSYMIFWWVTTPLHRLSIYFLLFQFETCLPDQEVSALCFSSSADNKRVVQYTRAYFIQKTYKRFYLMYSHLNNFDFQDFTEFLYKTLTYFHR